MNPPRPLQWQHGIWAFFVAIILQVIVSFLMAALSGHQENAGAHFLASAPGVALQIVMSSGVFALVAVLFAFRPAGSFTTSWLLQPTRWPILLLGTLGALAVGVLTDGLMSFLFQFYPEQFDLALLESLGYLFRDASTIHFVWLTIAITLGPAFGEELLFRGILLNGFAHSWKGPWAVIVSSILFGVMHMDMLQGVGAAFIGLYLGYIVYRSGSIWPGILAHGVNNLAVSLTARVETTGLRETLEQGHPPLVLALAGMVAILTVVGIEKLLRRGKKPAADPQRSS